MARPMPSLMNELWKLQAKGTTGLNPTTHGPEAWKDVVLKISKYLFPDVAIELDTMVQQEEEEPPEDPGEDATAFERAEYEHETKEILELRSRRRRQRKKMVAFMALYISKDVHSTAQRTYGEFDTEGNIPECYTAIKKASLRIGTRDQYREKADADKARADFIASGWKRHDTLEKLWTGYDNEVTKLFAELDMVPISPEDQVRDVIEALPPLLSEYQADKQNDYTKAINKPAGTASQAAAKALAIAMVYPADLNALYAEVSDYKIKTVDRQGNKIRANFATLVCMGLDKVEKEVTKALNFVTDFAANKENRRQRNGGKADRAPREPKEVDTSKPAPGPCPGCGQRYGPDKDNKGKWHWLQKCPRYLELTKQKEEAEKKKSKGERKRDKKMLATLRDPTAVVLGDPGANYSTLALKSSDIPQSTLDIYEHARNFASANAEDNTKAYFDTCCSAATYCNPKLLSNIRKGDGDMAVQTAAGVYYAELVGDSIIEGKVIFNRNSPGNICCADDLQHRYKVTAVEQKIADDHFIIAAYVVHLPQYNVDIVFKRDGKVFIADLRDLLQKFPNFSQYAAPKPVKEPAQVTTADIELALGRKLLTIEPAGTNFAVKQDPEESLDFEPRVTGKITDSDLVKRAVKGAAIFETTKRQLQKAIKAHKVLDLMGGNHHENMEKLIANGEFTSQPHGLTAGDFRRAAKLVLPNAAKYKGTMAMKKKKRKDFTDSLEENQLTAEFDILYLGSIPIFFSVVRPSMHVWGHILAEDVASKRGARSAGSIQVALGKFFDYYERRQWKVVTATGDPEKGFEKNAAFMASRHCTYDPGDKSDGVPHIDNRSREIKRIARRVSAELNLKEFFASIVKVLFFYCVAMLNARACEANVNSVSPNRVINRGKQTDFHKFFRFRFLQRVAVNTEDRIQRNSGDKDNAFEGLALWPKNDSGTWQVLNLETGFAVDRKDIAPVRSDESLADTLAKVSALKSEKSFDTAILFGESDTDDEIDESDEPAGTEPERDQQKTDFFRVLSPLPRTPHARISTTAPAALPPPADGIFSHAPSSHSNADAAEREGVGVRTFSSPLDMMKNRLFSPGAAEPTSMSKFIDDVNEESATSTYTRPYRDRRPPDKYRDGEFVTYATIKEESTFLTQMSAKRALRELGPEAKEALVKEIDGILQRKVWHGVLRSSLSKTQHKKIIRSSCFIKPKVIDGIVATLKARFVAGGNTQDRSIYDESQISSPTASIAAILTIIAQAAAKGHKVMTFDIGQAYLNADMGQDVFVYLSKEMADIVIERDPSYAKFVEPNGQILVKLDKALYGCIESAKLWYDHFKGTLESLGYEVNPMDPCVFNRKNTDGTFTTIAVYVDDALVTSPKQAALDELAEQMKKRYGVITVKTGDIHHYLGMKLDFSQPKFALVTMQKYIEDLIVETATTGTARTPAAENLFEIDVDAPPLDKIAAKTFHRVVAQCLYLACRARPDILCATIFLTTRVQAPTAEDNHKLNRLLKYLHGTKELGIMLGGDEAGNIGVTIYADAAFNKHPNGRSHAGIFITLGRGPVVAKSNSIKAVAKSSAEAELMSASDGVSIGEWVHEFVVHQPGGEEIGPSLLKEDNTAAIQLMKNGRSNSARTGHIKLRYFFVKQYIDDGSIILEHCPTDEMVADILTKPLQGSHFEYLRSYLLGYEIP